MIQCLTLSRLLSGPIDCTVCLITAVIIVGLCQLSPLHTGVYTAE